MSLSIFNTAISGLNAAMKNIQVTSHNIGNISTKGYSRQQAITVNKAPLQTPYGSVAIGQGAEVQSVTRIRNEYLDEEFRKCHENVGYYEMMQEGYSSVETFFGEPSDVSFSATMNDFWTSLSELSKNPDSIASRNVVIEAAKTLINTFNKLNTDLKNIDGKYDESIDTTIFSINSLTSQIYGLNETIRKAEATGGLANDLRDQRDNVIDSLSKLINIEVNDDSTGGKTISINGTLVVGEELHREIATERDNLTKDISICIKGLSKEVLVSNGQLGGLLDFKNKALPNVLEKVDNLVNVFAKEFNNVHRKGFGLDGTTGLDFFVSTDGKPFGINNVAINSEILDDYSKFAAATNLNMSGDNDNLLKLADLKNQKLIEVTPGISVSLSDFYANLITGIGVKGNSSNKLLKTQEDALEVVDLNRLSVNGVSSDEELTNLSAYQHAYNANAHMVSTLNEMLDTLLDMV